MASNRLLALLSILCLTIIATTANQLPGNPIVYAQDGTSTFAMVNGQMIPIPQNDNGVLSSVKNFFKIDWSNNALVRSIKNISSYFSSQTQPPLEFVEYQGLPSSHNPQYASPNGAPVYRPNNLQYQEPPKQQQQQQQQQSPQFPPLHFNPYPNRPATFQNLPPQQLRGAQLQADPHVFNHAFQQQQQLQSQYPQQRHFQQQPKQQLPPQPINIMAPSAHQMPMRPQQQQQQQQPEASMPAAARSNIIKIPGGIEVITHDMPDGGLSLNSIEPFQSNEVPLDDAYHSSVVEPMPSRQSQQQTDPTDTDFEGDNPCPVVGQWKWDGTYCIALGPMPRWACKPTDLVPTGRLAVCRNRIAYPNESHQE